MADTARIPQFDGLRALAFMAVFLHHAVHAPLLWMGVDQFFVLSGFLITRNLLELGSSSTVRSSIVTFYYRRLLRIVPPYYLALTLTFVVTPIALHELGWFYGFASNVRDAIHNKPIEGPLNPMWSIAVEEQFYLIWPWIVLLAPRHRLRSVFVAVVVLAFAFRFAFTSVGFHSVYRLVLCRMDQLAAGALLALASATKPRFFADNRGRFAAAAVAAIAVFAGLSLALPTFRTSHNDLMFNLFGFGLSTLFFTAMLGLVAGLGSSGLVAGFLCHPVMRYVGKISYMAYLIHMFAIVTVARLHLGMLPTATAALALTIAIASASWYAMEAPLSRLRRLVNPKPAGGS
ncbi:MAG TPA: acyltransferase [Kofleriaceae bacterium]|nr:acyltransferase [Kofleriaceae bacterium]